MYRNLNDYNCYREEYMANMQCDYIIQVARGSTVNLHITDLDMEITADCNYDYISVSHTIITRLTLFFIFSFFLQN